MKKGAIALEKRVFILMKKRGNRTGKKGRHSDEKRGLKHLKKDSSFYFKNRGII